MRQPSLALRLGALTLAAVWMASCAPRPGSPLTQAAVRNDVAALRRLLDAGAGPDGHDGSWTALIWAARSGSIDAMRVLIDADADVNRPGPTGDGWDATPLQHAILERQPAAVRVLLERGADANRRAGAGSAAPLLLAADDTDPTILNLLLAHGADPMAEDERGATALTHAVAAGTFHGPDRPMFGGCRVETVRALLAHDPRPRVTRNDAWTNALWWARVQRCHDVLRLVGE